MARDSDNNTRGPRKPPRRGAGRPGAGGSGAGRGGGGGRFRDDKPSRGPGGGSKRFGERKPFAGKRDERAGGERPFRGKPQSGEGRGFRKDGDRPRGERSEHPRGERYERPRGERSERPRGERYERPRGERSEHPRGERHDGPRREGRAGGFKKDFKPRDRDAGERRPWSEDRPRGERSERSRGERYDRPQRERGGGRSFEKREGGERSERPRFDRNREDRPRFSRNRDDKPRFSRDRDGKPPFRRDREERGDRPPRRDHESRGADRPRGERSERPRFNRDDKPRFSRDRDSKPGFSRDRGERKFDRPREDRPPRGERSEHPRGARNERPRREWQDHPRSEGGFRGRDGDSRPPRRDFRRDGERSEGRGEGRRFDRNERPRVSRGREDRPRFNREDRGESAPRSEGPPAEKNGERIAKVVARAGLSSRREAEQWITDGRVAVNGRVITSPALDVVPSDVITIDGRKLPEREPTRLFLHHKPRGLVTTHSDPEGRPTVFEQLPEDLPRVISVGRLDYNTEGLLLLTNDGALARALELPANGWLRRYRVRAHGEVTQEALDALKDGIEIDGVRYGAIEATLDRDQGANVWITFEIREGKNREVRNVLAHLGLDVNRLIRTSYGPFQLGELAEGAVEEVDPSSLREQLGEKVAGIARLGRDGASETKPKQRRSGLIADRKGRRVLVERSANAPRDDEDGGDDAPRRPPRRRYHGKSQRD